MSLQVHADGIDNIPSPQGKEVAQMTTKKPDPKKAGATKKK
jgi:hypothetical protein